MSLSIPSDNLRKINSLDEIPYKVLRNYKVKQNYDNQLQYLSTLNIDEVNNQIEQDINDYNNYIDFIITKNNRITSKVTTEQLDRNILTEGNRYVIGKDGIEHTILDNEWNRKNVTVDIEGNIIGKVENEPMD